MMMKMKSNTQPCTCKVIMMVGEFDSRAQLCSNGFNEKRKKLG